MKHSSAPVRIYRKDLSDVYDIYMSKKVDGFKTYLFGLTDNVDYIPFYSISVHTLSAEDDSASKSIGHHHSAKNMISKHKAR